MINRGHAVGLFLFVVLIAASAPFLPLTSNWIDIAANNIYPYPGGDIHLDYFLGAMFGLSCGIFLLVGPFPPSLRPALLVGWAAKLASALFIMPIYEYAYGLDIDKYFSIGGFPEITTAALGKGNAYIRVLTWFMFQAIGPNFHAGKVLFTFIGFMGIYLCYRGAVLFLRKESPGLLLITTLSPTCLFWSSLLGKDPICLFGVGLYVFGSLGWLTSGRHSYLFLIVLGALFTSVVRSYFLPILAVPLSVAYFMQTRRALVRLFLFPVFIFGTYFSVVSFRDSFKIDSFEAFAQYQANLISGWGGGSAYSLPLIDSPIALLLVAPLGAFTALFRPLLFEAHNPFALVASIDNTVLLIIAAYAFKRSKLKEFGQPEILWMSAFILLWSTLHGLGSGNLGALSRFKIQILPIFITLLVYMARKRPAAPVSPPR